ncbi:MAG: hypothetical protein SF029_01550 [bacterium]|nr:hypothetical protein [bacterium]
MSKEQNKHFQQSSQTLHKDAEATQEVTVKLPFAREDIESLAQRRGFASIEEYIAALLWQDDDALWDENMAANEAFFDELAQKALSEYHAGETEAFDPDDNIDMP